MRVGLDSDQIYYLKTVLGLSDVLLPHLEPAPAEKPPTEIRGAIGNAKMLLLLPLEAKEFPLHGPLEELVERMMKAMKLEPAQILRLSWVPDSDLLPEEIENYVDQAGHRPVLFFGHHASLESEQQGAWQAYRAARAMLTFAPRDLLTSNENKRVAWVHLQSVMKELR